MSLYSLFEPAKNLLLQGIVDHMTNIYKCIARSCNSDPCDKKIKPTTFRQVLHSLHAGNKKLRSPIVGILLLCVSFYDRFNITLLKEISMPIMLFVDVLHL